MPTSHTARTSSSSTTRRATATRRSGEVDAIQLLKADHAEAKKLFAEFEKLSKAHAPANRREAIASEVCTMLTVHTTIEEEIFYPAARDALGRERDLLDEAAVEHASAKDLIEQIRSASPDDEMFDAKVKVLGEYVMHHVKEEQNELFPKLKGKMDLREVGERLKSRKEELLASGETSH
jgi:hemerythrin superfamily protein